MQMTKSTHTLEIISRSMDLTPSLKSRVEGKIGKVVEKLGANAKTVHVVLKVYKFPIQEMHSHVTKKDSQIVEVTIGMKGGSVIHATEKSEDMYASIDLASHKIAQSLKRHNGKVKSRKFQHPDKLPLTSESEGQEEEVIESFDESTLLEGTGLIPATQIEIDMSVVRPKKFPMPPILVEEAVLCLSFIDHPFYVFKNKESNEINVVYKRADGGYGHIMPEDQ